MEGKMGGNEKQAGVATPAPVPSSPEQGPKKSVALVVVIVVVLTVAALAVAVGEFWLSWQDIKRIGGSEGVPIENTEEMMEDQEQPAEVPFGDEGLENDPAYQAAMEAVKTEMEDAPNAMLIPFADTEHGFGFRYPATVFLQRTDGVNNPLIYLDTKMIVVPDVYGGPLTPVEIRVKPLVTFNSLDEAVSESSNLFVPGTLTKTPLTGSVTGMRLAGNQRIYGEDQGPFERVLLDSPGGVVVIDYIPSDEFPQDLFDNIISTLVLLVVAN